LTAFQHSCKLNNRLQLWVSKNKPQKILTINKDFLITQKAAIVRATSQIPNSSTARDRAKKLSSRIRIRIEIAI